MFVPRNKYVSLKRLKQLERNSNGKRYQVWRDYVFDRDNHTCQYPGCGRKNKIQAHHIKKFASAIHLRTTKWNGITLCYECHKRVTGREGVYESLFFDIAANNEKKYQSDNDSC